MSFVKFECWVCGEIVEHDLAIHHKPQGWKDKPIAGGVHTLCAACVPHSKLNDGMACQMVNDIYERHNIKVEVEGC